MFTKTTYLIKQEKFRVVPLGFDLDRFRTAQQEKRMKFRTEFNLADDEIAIGIIGRLVPVKNHYLFLKAIRHVFDNSSKKSKSVYHWGRRDKERP